MSKRPKRTSATQEPVKPNFGLPQEPDKVSTLKIGENQPAVPINKNHDPNIAKQPALAKKPKDVQIQKKTTLRTERICTNISKEHFDKLEEIKYLSRKFLRVRTNDCDVLEEAINRAYTEFMKKIDRIKEKS